MPEEPKSRLQQLQEEARSIMDDTAVAAAEHRMQFRRARAFVHFWIMVGRSFARNRCPVRASALAYSSLLAMIPMLALVLSVTTSILKSQGEQPVRNFVNRMVQEIMPSAQLKEGVELDEQTARIQAEVARTRDETVKKINEFINKTQTGTIGGTSAIVLLFVAISMLSRVEETFNDIWGVARGRSWYMRVVLYWAAITLGPVVLISAIGLTTAGQLQFGQSNPLHVITDLALVRSLVGTYLPILVLSTTFGMVYLLLPNTRVHFSAAMVGGLTAGLLWQLNNELSARLVSRLTSNTAIYGSLAMVPVFMIGMYFGWLILLFGAQVAYAFQNRQAYLQERLAEGINHRGRELAAVRLMIHIAARFQRGDPPPSAPDISRECGLPGRLVGQLLTVLARARLVLEVHDRETRFAPGRPLDAINLDDVLGAVRTGSGSDLLLTGGAERLVAEVGLGRARQAEQAVAKPTTMRQLVEEAAQAGPGEGKSKQEVPASSSFAKATEDKSRPATEET